DYIVSLDEYVYYKYPPDDLNEVKSIDVYHKGKRDLSNLTIEDRIDARGRQYFWLGYRPALGVPQKGSDLWAVANGCVSVTPLSLNLTGVPLTQKMQKAFS